MTDDETQSDNELAARAQTGDRRAFDLLVQRQKGSLFRVVRRYIGNEDDAYDIVQDTFISAWIALRRYDTRKSFAVWTRAIALNKCRDYSRRQAVRRRFLKFFAPKEEALATEDQSSGAEWEAAEANRLMRLDAAIADLSPFYKEPLILTTVAGLSQQEAARQLNTTVKAIEMRTRRARRKLAESLSDLKREG